MLRRPSRPLPRLALAGVAVLALAVGVGCSGDEDVTREDFTEKLRDRVGEDHLTEDEALCITDRVYDEFDQAQVNAIVWAATEDELSQATQDSLRAINEECLAPE